MNTHIVSKTGNRASHCPRSSVNFLPAHLYPHPHHSNEKITRGRNFAIWPARSVQPRFVIGLCSGNPLSPDCSDV
jgi:hypothetical protein